MIAIQNVFDPYREHSKVTYNAPNVDETQQKIQQHLPSYLQNLAPYIANEAQLFKTPAAQIMTDIFHQSKQKWPDFIKNTTLSALRRDHINIFTALQTYQSQFNSSIYAPLHEYLSTSNTKFKGDAEELIFRISQIVNQVKWRQIRQNNGVQFDVRYTPKIASDSSDKVQAPSNFDGATKSNSYKNDFNAYDSESDDEEAFEYTYNFDETSKAQSYQTDFTSSSSKSIVSDILEHADITKEDTTNLDKIVRRILDKECNDLSQFHYPRYEILMNGKFELKSFPVIENKTIPAIDIETVPFCRIFNSTNSVQSILDYLSATGQKQTSHLMTFSIHYYYGQIEIYFYIYADGKLYGSRMFEEDIMRIIPQLFENGEIEDEATIQHNFKMDNHVLNVEFNHPKKYKECKLVLFKPNERKLEYELGYKLKGQLEQFISEWNATHTKLHRVNINQIVDIFLKYKIDYAYFEDGNNRRQFIRILQRKDIATNVANELWMEFGGGYAEETDTVSECLSITSSQRLRMNCSLLRQHQLIKAKQETAKQQRINQQLANALQQEKNIRKQQEDVINNQKHELQQKDQEIQQRDQAIQILLSQIEQLKQSLRPIIYSASNRMMSLNVPMRPESSLGTIPSLPDSTINERDDKGIHPVALNLITTSLSNTSVDMFVDNEQDEKIESHPMTLTPQQTGTSGYQSSGDPSLDRYVGQNPYEFHPQQPESIRGDADNEQAILQNSTVSLSACDAPEPESITNYESSGSAQLDPFMALNGIDAPSSLPSDVRISSSESSDNNADGADADSEFIPVDNDSISQQQSILSSDSDVASEETSSDSVGSYSDVASSSDGMELRNPEEHDNGDNRQENNSWPLPLPNSLLPIVSSESSDDDESEMVTESIPVDDDSASQQQLNLSADSGVLSKEQSSDSTDIYSDDDNQQEISSRGQALPNPFLPPSADNNVMFRININNSFESVSKMDRYSTIMDRDTRVTSNLTIYALSRRSQPSMAHFHYLLQTSLMTYFRAVNIIEFVILYNYILYLLKLK